MAGKATWLDAAVAAGGGAVWGLCFGETGRILLPWVALAPLFWLLGRPRAPLLALLHGAAAWIVAIPWIVPTLVTYGEMPAALAVVLFLLLTLYLGAFHAVFAWWGRSLWPGAGVAAVRDRFAATTALVALPALWCLIEVARGWLLSGFPWNLAGYAWIEVPGALPVASWIGVYGVSFLAVFANAAIALAAVRRRFEPAAAACLTALLVLALGMRWARPPAGAGPSVPVRIVQPNTPILGAGDRAAIDFAYRRLLRFTDEACDREGALVVWPESAGWPFILERDPMFRADLEAAAARGCAILLNSPRFEGDSVYNAAFLIEPAGTLAHYDKRHLVPFGEYVPLGRVLPFVDALARNAGGFTASDRLGLLEWRSITLGLAICFEVTFPGEVAALGNAGATALASLTNDAWYGASSAPWQHLRAARFRAAENQRTLVRAALTGVSAWIEPDGRLAASLGVGEEGILRGDLHPRDQPTPYARAPWAIPVLCAVLAGAAHLSAILAKPR